jgi:hypothetical protein
MAEVHGARPSLVKGDLSRDQKAMLAFVDEVIDLTCREAKTLKLHSATFDPIDGQ